MFALEFLSPLFALISSLESLAVKIFVYLSILMMQMEKVTEGIETMDAVSTVSVRRPQCSRAAFAAQGGGGSAGTTVRGKYGRDRGTAGTALRAGGYRRQSD